MLIAFACQARAKQQSSAQTPDELFQEATRLVQSGEYSAAASVLDRLRVMPLPPPQIFQVGWLYGRARRFDLALRTFESLPAETPDPASHAYAIALSEFELSDYKAAVAALAPLESQHLCDATCANLLGVSWSKLGRPIEAYRAFHDSVEQEPQKLNGYLNIVTLLADNNDLEDAAKFASDAVQRFPDSAQAVIVRGAAFLATGHVDEARRDFAHAAELAPGNADACFFVALVDYQQGRPEDAAGKLQRAIESGMNDADLHYLLAECLLRSKDRQPERAREEVDRAIRIDPKHIAARTLRGKLLLEQGRTQDAVADLELAHRQDPSSPAALYNLARAYQLIGKTEESRKLFQTLRAMKTDSLEELTRHRVSQALGEGRQAP